MKNIVIVGAGYAGVLTAKKLEKRLKKRSDVKITVIDKNPFHTMYTELHEVAAHRVEEDSVKISLKRVFAGRDVQVILDTVLEIDFDRRVLKGDAGTYSYDYLVLAAGSKPTFFGVPGAAEISYTLWSYDDAVKLREHLLHVFRRAARETDPDRRRVLLTFYVVGAGFTGVEMAGELAEWIPQLCEEFEIDPGEVTMCDVDVLDRAVPILPEKLSGKVERRLKKMGVQVMLGTSVAGMGKNYIELKQGDSVARHEAGTVIWTAGIESSGIVSKATLQTAGRGRVVTDQYLCAMGREEVFVAGDNIMYVPTGKRDPVPQMVENCEQSADTVARNLAAAVTGTGKMEEYRPKFHGVMVSVGGRYGVAQVGTPNHMVCLPSFFAMFTKHFINVVYFMQVLGWNKVFSYLRHEFFTIRNRRSFLGGHFSNRTPSFLLVPLRIWLGLVWVFEGVMKIVEGWMNTPMLTGFFGGANAFYNQILSAAGARNLPIAAGAVDAVASATAEVGEAVSGGVAVFSYRILGFLDAIMVSSADLAHSTVSTYAFKLDFPPVNWMVNQLILPSERVQLFMQIGIVMAEIIIGLCLIGGFFTFLTSGVSLVLQFMFVCTTGLYFNTFWMIFAAVAVLIGGGRTIGLDYYVMPYLKKRWKNLPFIRKWYLYND